METCEHWSPVCLLLVLGTLLPAPVLHVYLLPFLAHWGMQCERCKCMWKAPASHCSLAWQQRGGGTLCLPCHRRSPSLQTRWQAWRSRRTRLVA